MRRDPDEAHEMEELMHALEVEHVIRRAPGLWPRCAVCGETIVRDRENAYVHLGAGS